jgi:hypothetical protein
MIMKGKESGKERNIWKLVSVVFIAMFILILVWGLISLRSRPQFLEPTSEQVDMARNVVAQDLQTMGDSIDDYEVIVTDRMVGFIGMPGPRNGMPGIKHMGPPNGMRMRNLQVSLRGNSTGYLYIIDLDSEGIAMRSFTEWFND